MGAGNVPALTPSYIDDLPKPTVAQTSGNRKRRCGVDWLGFNTIMLAFH